MAFERVEAAEPAMPEAVKEVASLSRCPAWLELWPAAALRNYCSPHRTVLAPTNKCLAESNKSDAGGKATKKRESRSKALFSGP
jgi:hypothetical protein